MGDITAQLKDGVLGGKFALTEPLLVDFKSHNTNDSANHCCHVLQKPYTRIKNKHYGKLCDIIWLHDTACPNMADGFGPTCHKMGGAYHSAYSPGSDDVIFTSWGVLKKTSERYVFMLDSEV